MKIEKVHEHVFMSLRGCKDQRWLQETQRPERNFCSPSILSTFLLSLIFILRNLINRKALDIIICIFLDFGELFYQLIVL